MRNGRRNELIPIVRTGGTVHLNNLNLILTPFPFCSYGNIHAYDPVTLTLRAFEYSPLS